ncbi:MAG: outer membrane protein assembly factor BamE [Holosporales bacterium]|jgi:outer membrane protein assembly factor BamE (lipoprotein component of BamABCDE complex)|nr:outer membrane protein assembly factor BamE [Holosporales bacterium]
MLLGAWNRRRSGYHELLREYSGAVDAAFSDLHSKGRGKTWEAVLYRSLLWALLLAACTPTQDIRGNLVDQEDIARLVPYKHTREDVVEILGPPSLKVEENKWLYLGQEQTRVAFLTPKVKGQRSFLVLFDAAGRYLRTERCILKGRHLLPDPEISPQKGKEITILGQTLDNLRRATQKKK